MTLLMIATFEICRYVMQVGLDSFKNNFICIKLYYKLNITIKSVNQLNSFIFKMNGIGVNTRYNYKTRQLFL